MQNIKTDLQRQAISLIILVLLVINLLPQCVAREQQLVLGAGPSTVVAKHFFQLFSAMPAARDYEFVVPPRSTKHAGGIRAAEKYLFGRTGRPLNEKEKKRNKHELYLARIPLSFVVGKKTGVKRISLEQLESIYLRKISNWKELGGADADIMLAGREYTEAAFSVIRQKYPFFEQVDFDVTLNRDHQLVNLVNSSRGDYAIGFGARSNFAVNQLIQVDAFEAGVNLGLVYDSKNTNHPVIKAAIDFAGSDTWKKHLSSSGFLPPDR